MTRLFAATAVAFISTLAPVAAAPFCTDSRAGFSIEFGVGAGRVFSENDSNDFDMMELRRMGVDATRVERWNGCIRAFVRQPGGGEAMQFYDPNSFERVF